MWCRRLQLALTCAGTQLAQLWRVLMGGVSSRYASIDSAAPMLQQYNVGGCRVRVLQCGGAGEGGFAFVDLVEELDSGMRRALKRCLCQSEEQLDLARAEIRVMLALQPHPNIIPLLQHAIEAPSAIRSETTQALLLMPFCQVQQCPMFIRRH